MNNRSPDRPSISALLREAIALHQARRFDDSERMYDAVLKLDPVNGDALNLKGALRADQGRPAEAVALFDEALKRVRNFAPLHFNRANSLCVLGRLEEALESYARAISLKSDYADAWLNSGLAFEKTGRLQDAIVAFRAMTRNCPGDARGFYNLGVCLEKLLARKNIKKKTVVPEAFAAFEQALARAPNDASVHCGLGTLCARLGDYKNALAHTERAVQLKPDWADAWVNLGGHKEALGDREGALAAFDHALRIDPNNSGAAVNRGLTLLALGRLSEGWPGYARRFEDPRFPFIRREWPWPPWKGDSLTDRTILLWGDQGVGDEILYAGLIPEVAQRAKRCVVECAPRLEPLFRRSFPNVEIVGRSDIGEETLRAIPFDCQSSLLDVGRWLRPTVSAFPNRRAILVGDLERAKKLRQAYLGRSGGTTLVGLSWRSLNPAFGAQKSLELGDFESLLKNPKLTFVNVQYAATEEELRATEDTYKISLIGDPEIDPLTDLDGLASQLLALDMLITVSNTTAHLAGALGVPTWLYIPDGHKRLWYWLDHGAYSPWYRSVSICREPKAGSIAALSTSWAEAQLSGDR